MRFRLPLAIAVAAIVIFVAGASRSANAQANTNVTFAKAQQLEKQGKKKEALDEYQKVARETKDPETAAQALYQGGLLGAYRYDGSETEKRAGQDSAIQYWKEIYLKYPTTKAYREMTQSEPGAPHGQYSALQEQLDRRNSSDIKYLIIDVLVALTGRNPNYSYGIALILLAVLVKLITWPLTKKQYQGMRDMQRMQPLVKELQKKYKGTELHEKTLALYKEHNVNMFGGCLPMAIQMPFLIAVYAGVRAYEFGFAKGKFLWIGSALSHNGATFMGHNVFGRNLADPDVPLLALYSVTMYLTTKMNPAVDPQQQQQQNTMGLTMAIVFFYIFLNNGWSSAFVLYWLMTNVFNIWQQYEYIYKPHRLKMSGEGGGGDAGSGGPTLSPAVSSNGTGTVKPDSRVLGTGGQPGRVKPRKKKR